MSFLKKKSKGFRSVCCLLAFLLVQNSLEQVQAQPTPFLPPGNNYFVDLSIPYSLPVLRGMRVYPTKPFEFDFMVGSGDRHTIDQKETSLLIKYFLTCLTVPQEDLWVNLSPYESGRIIPNELALTNAGNTLLEQDKFLKQLASSLTYPESRLGKKFWEEVYKKAYEKFGTTNLPVSTYNKVWIVPDKAIVYDMGDSAIIGETHLKVLLDEDYLALKKHMRVEDEDNGDLHKISAVITKEIILPELEKEINEGKNFAPVRQIFHSMILAAWFKRALKRNVLAHFYVNKKKISGVDDVDKKAKEEIYKQYLRIYKVGAYNYIREDVDPISQQVVPRKYFSGGLFFGDLDKAMKTLQVPDPQALLPILERSPFADVNDGVAHVRLTPIGGEQAWDQLMKDQAMRTGSPAGEPSLTKRLVLSVVLAVNILSPLNVLAQTNGLHSNPPALGQALIAPLDGVLPQTPAVLEHVLKKGDSITREDGKDIQRLKEFVSVEDVENLNQTSNSITGKHYRVDIDNMRKTWASIFTESHEDWRLQAIVLTAQHKLNLRENGRLGEETRNALRGSVKVAEPLGGSPGGPPPPPDNIGVLTPVPAGAPSTIPQALPAVQSTLTQQAAQGAAIVTQAPTHFGKKFYLYSRKLPAVSLPDILKVKIGGFVEGLDKKKTEYAENEIILTIKNLELESRIQATQTALELAQETLVRLQQARDAQSATSQEVENAQKEVQRLKDELAQEKTKQGLGIVRAPHKMTVRDFQIDNDVSVREGAPLFSYFDGDRVRFDIYLPISVHSNDFDLTINGAPVKSIDSENWLPTASLSTAHLSLIVTTTSPLVQGQEARVALKIYSPDNNSNKMLNTIVASGGTAVEVGKIETYPITAPADGQIKFLAREGDKVKAGQIVARVDSPGASYQEQFKQAENQVTIIEQELREDHSASGTVGIEDINRLEIEKSQWEEKAVALKDLIAHLDIKAPQDGVIAWSSEHGSGEVKSGDEIFSYSRGTVFLGDIDIPQNGILFPEGKSIKRGNLVLVKTKEGIRLIGEVTNVNKAFSPQIQLANQSVEVKVWDPQHALRTGMFVNVSLLDNRNQEIAQRVLSEEKAAEAPALSGSPPPDDEAVKIAEELNLGPDSQIPAADPGEPPMFYPAPGESLSLSDIEQRVQDYNLTAVTQRYDYLQKQLAEKYPNSKSLNLNFNVYTSGGKTYYGGGIAGQLPNLAINIVSGNAYGAVAPIAYSYFLKIAGLLTHEKAKQVEFAKIQTEIALLQYKIAVYDQVSRAKNTAIDLGAQEQNSALLEQLIIDLQRARKVIADRVNLGLSTEEELRAFDDNIAEAKEAASKSYQSSGKFSIELNTLTGQKDLHIQNAIDLPWDAEFPTISPQQENDWVVKLAEKNPQILQKKSEIDVVRQKIKLQKPKGWGASTAGVYTTGPINNSITEPAIGGGEEYRASLMNPGENAANGITIPLFNGAKRIDDKIIAVELQKRQAELDLKISTLKGELTATVSALRDLSKQINQVDEAYQNALRWWELKSRFPDIYSSADAIKEREAMNKWAMKRIDLRREYLQNQEQLRKLGVLDPNESLTKDKAMNSEQAELARPSLLRNILLGLVAVFTPAIMPLGAQQARFPGEFQAWSSTRAFNTNVSDPNIFNRGPATETLLAEFRANKADIKRFETIFMNASPDVRQEILRFMIERQDLRFFIQMIDKADKEKNRSVVNLSYQSIGDIFTDDPKILDELYSNSFISSSDYPDQTDQTEKAFLTFIAQNPDGLAQTNLLLSKFWRTDQLAHLYNKFDGYLSGHPDDKQIKGLKGLIYDVMVRKIFLETIDAHFTPGELQNANSYSPFYFRDNIARGRLEESPVQYRVFFNSPDWRKEMGNLRPDLLGEANNTTQGLIDADRQLNPVGIINSRPLDEISNRAVAQDSLALFGLMDYFGQQKYIAKAKNSELARILESREILQNPLLLNDLLNRLMADKDGRLLVLQAYAQSPDDSFLKLIEAAQNIDTVKQDAQGITNPAAMRIFRGALEKMYGRLGYPWLLKARLDTYSSIELYSLSKGLSIDQQTVKAQVKLIATQWALAVLLEDFPKLKEKDSFIAGAAVYPSEKYDLLNRVAEKLKSLNDPKELDDYLNEQSAASGEDKKTIDELKSYRDTYAELINGNNQEITQGHWWMRSIQWLYNTDLFLSAALIAFGALYTLLPKFRDWYKRKFASLGHLMDISDKEYLNSKLKREGNGEINGNKVEPSVFALLTAWGNKLKDWSKHDDYPTEDLLSDQQLINNFADEIFTLIPYTPDLMDSKAKAAPNQAYQDSYAYFIKLANKTLRSLSERLKNKDLTETQRERFLQSSETLLLKMVYVQKYLDILQGRVNINTTINEHFHKEDNKEKTNKIATWLLGYEFLSYKPKKKLRQDLRDLMETGNLTIPGLYNDIDTVINESQKRLNEVIFKGKRFGSFGYAESSENTRIRSWLSRLIFLVPNIYFLVKSILGYSGVIPFKWLDVIFFVSSLSLTLANYWSPILSNSRLAENKKTKEIMMRLYNNIKGFFGLEEKIKDWKLLKKSIKEGVKNSSGEQEIVRLAQKEGEEYRAREFKVKSVDVIVFIAENPQDIPGLQERAQEMVRDKLIREDVPCEILPWGSLDGDTFLQTLLIIKSKWQNARKMVVIVGNGVKPDDPRLALSVKNLYGAAVNMPSGGLVMGNASEIYLGPALKHDPPSDMTFGTTWASMDDLYNQSRPSRPWLVTDLYEGLLEIRKIFEKLDLRSRLRKDKNEIGGSSTIDMLEKRYDLSNGALQQFSEKNGIVRMGARAVAMFTSIAEELRGQPLRLDADLFVPVLMATSHGIDDQERLIQEIVDYEQAQHLNGYASMGHDDSERILKDMKATLEGDKTKLYLKIAEVVRTKGFQNFKVTAHLPNRGLAIFEPNPAAERAHQLLPADAAMSSATKSPGGVDLNFQPQFIQQGSKIGAMPSEGAVLSMPDGFKGFNFNIVRFTPELTINSAFQLMFTSTNG